MKAILFAVASMFVVTASVTPSLARPYYQDRAVTNFSHGFQSLSHRAYQGRSYWQTAYSAHHYRHSESYARGTQYYRQHANYTRAARHYVSTRVTRAGSRYHQHASSIHSTGSGHYATGARPARWCGWWMRTQKGGGPELNLASNWRHWGRPSGPQIGAVVVWRHHVGMITGRAAGGQWIVKSGNDGGRVRERPRSVAGAVFRI